VTEINDYRGVEGTRPYAGTAEYYARYRPRVTEAFLDELVPALGWSPQSRVLDLGTGPGQLALRIAPRVGEVVGVDPEPDMLEVAERLAQEKSITNARFVRGSSNDLRSLELGEFTSATMSASFHWMLDQDRVMADLAAFTDAEHGSVAFVSAGWFVTRSADYEAAERIVHRILDDHLSDVPEGPHPRGRHDPFEEILARSAFSNLSEIEVRYEADAPITAEAVLGLQYSVSHVLTRLGPRRERVENEVANAFSTAGLPETTRVVYRDHALIGRRD